MAISQTGRRKIVVGGRRFIWWVYEADPEFWFGDLLPTALTVASEDRGFVVRYYLDQRADQAYVIVLGREFGGLAEAGGGWLRVRSPKFETDHALLPSDVRRLIEWSLSSDEPRVQLDWQQGRD